MSARTGGYTLLQLLFDLGTPGRQTDRVLNGPTSDVWISPWLAYLEQLGVNFELGGRVEELEVRAGRIGGVIVSDSRSRRRVEADWYVAALPVEHMNRLTNDAVLESDPELAQLSRLVTRWMNGIVFFLRRAAPIVHGHVIYIDSPWSLTSISQTQVLRATSQLLTSDMEMCAASSQSISRNGRRPDFSQARQLWSAREKKLPPRSSPSSGRTSRQLTLKP